MEINLNSKRVTLKTAKKYCPEDIELNVSLQGKSVTPAAIEQSVTPDTGYAGLSAVTVSPVATEPGAATPSAAAQVVTPSEGKFFSQFTVNATPTEQKTIDANGTFTPSAGKFFDSVTVNVNTAKPEQEKSVDLTTMAPVEVTPDAGYTLSKVTATPKAPLADTSDATAAAGDILSGKTAYVGGAKVTGSLGTQMKTATPSTASQTITPDTGKLLSSVVVEAAPLDESKTVTANTIPVIVRPSEGKLGMKLVGVNPTPSSAKTVTPTTSAQTVTPDGGTLLSSVTVNAAPLDAAQTVTAGTAAKTVNPTGSNIGLKSVTINPTPSSAKTVTPTKETQTVSPDSGKLLSGVTVNPIPAEYIIPSGTKDITANGTTDVTSFASVNVNVPSQDLSDATAVPSKILLGATAYTGAGKITGTIPTYDGSLRPDSVMPVKGDLITIESKQYRVLKITKTVAEVLAMYTSATSQAFDTSGNSNVYANSSLDVYLSQTFYNSLSTTMQNAIVAKTFTQDEWSWTFGSSGGTGTAIYQGIYGSSSQYRVGLTNAAKGASITRKCYVLSVQDIIDYLEVTTSMDIASTTLTASNIWLMVWNRTRSISEYSWLRTAYSDNSNNAFCVRGDTGYLDNYYVDITLAVRPAFQIDLSKVEFTK